MEKKHEELKEYNKIYFVNNYILNRNKKPFIQMISNHCLPR